ncbi:ATP-binding protein [Streptacidiphilus melanogenes]|uniref:ATP-binding protein n=1 Tax=Streptacidiphilus melanogenes TaxID=411235 RepID=UPI000A62CA20|nr:ATP-binding protein [Streptacidiphilus melanogenes]
MFSTPRNTEFVTVGGLEKQTGQPEWRFGAVVIKELLDNALDAAETASARPDVALHVAWAGGVALVTVTDNGAGIPAAVVERLLDFNVNVSDKEAVRSPTRGLQGNAMKTLLGMPHALGVDAPVVIDACGMRHMLTVSLDPGRSLVTQHTTTPSSRTTGTSVTVALPEAQVRKDEPGRWIRKFAAANPHARLRLEHGQNSAGRGVEIYEPTAPEGWRKPMPGDATSAHHYTPDTMRALVFGHVREHRNGGRDLPLREFISSFTGLSSTVKAKQIAALVPGISHLSGFQDQPGMVEVLLHGMREHSKAPTPAYLGRISPDHYRTVLDQAFGVEESWFARKTLTDNAGIPWLVEVTVARTRRPGSMSYAVNYSASFGDPLGTTRLTSGDVTALGAISFLDACDAAPRSSNGYLRAAVVHLVCPVPHFTDKGKTALTVPAEVAEACAQALATATRSLHQARTARDREHASAQQARKKAEAREKRERERAQAKEEKEKERAGRKAYLTKKAAVFAVIQEAIGQVSGGGRLPFSAHTLFYNIRPLALKLLRPGTKLASRYVEQELIPEWEREHGPIEGLYREPRGTLHHPHDPGGTLDLPLGTREVRAYRPAGWSFNKILVIEKAGLWPAIHASGIADRFDMAVITTEGYSSEACRELLARLPEGDVQIFVLHDADPDGYNIARTLAEETRRMPGHRVEVIDIGLTVEDALTHGLDPEPAVRDRALPARIIPHLTPTALDWFTGEEDSSEKGKTRWRFQRVELNAFTSPQLIAHIETKLAQHGAAGKVVPPAVTIAARARTMLAAAVDNVADKVITELVDASRLGDLVRAQLPLDELTAITDNDIAAHLAQHPARSWQDAVDHLIAAGLATRHPDLRDQTRQLLTQLLNTTTPPAE